MSRDSNRNAIPAGLMVVLWGSVAAWVHFGLGATGYEVALTHDDHKAISELSDKVRDRVISSQQTFEIGSGGVSPVASVEPPPLPSAFAPPPPMAKKAEIKPPPTPTVKKPDAPKDPAKKVVIVTKDPNPPEVLPPPPQMDKRIAVRQHVKPNQTDNPNAHFVGDEANTVEHEEVATITSHDRDDENPTPAGNHQNSDTRPGDNENQRVGEADEHKGDKNRAPGEHGTEFDVQPDPPPTHAMGPTPVQGPIAMIVPQSGGDGHQAATAPTPPVQSDPAGASAVTAPDVTSSPQGGWSFPLVNPNAGLGEAQTTGPGSLNRLLPQPGETQRAFGLGGNPGPGHVNINLTQQGVIAAVGQDQLRKEREADGERRKSEHRGSWQASNFERWRSAIENYVSSVKPGNQTALNTAAVPFATYINGIHNRIHPIFADTFLASLEGLPQTNILSDLKLMTRLEIVLSKDGHIVKMGINKTSGVTAFDIAALDSVQRASPFGPAPNAIVSPDGQVYLHWEFHRDEVYACSTMNARPYILNIPAGGAPPTTPNPLAPDPTPTNTHERGAPLNTGDTREGLLLGSSASDKKG